MPVSVTMPRLGESVTEGTVTRWLKQEGERVEADEPLLEVSTDKVDTEIPSPVAGTLLEIKVDEDETVEVGAELAVIGSGDAGGSGGGTAPAPAEEKAEPEEPAAEPEKPAAGVEPDAELADEILAFCADKLARFKTPRSIDFIVEMPRDPHGKLYKRKLREPYWVGRERVI